MNRKISIFQIFSKISKRATILLLLCAIQGVLNSTTSMAIPHKQCCFVPDISGIIQIVEYFKKLNTLLFESHKNCINDT